MTDKQINKQTDRETDIISYLRLNPFCGGGRVKTETEIDCRESAEVDGLFV